ncbi:hypothetical protein Ptr902_11967 [Pyrenophora tritici-repentis]|nr:hypothetical protein Ptr902_11967 [Pyrenophora tritici-repentis]
MGANNSKHETDCVAYLAAIAKGRRLLELMHRPTSKIDQSPWISHSDLVAQGYVEWRDNMEEPSTMNSLLISKLAPHLRVEDFVCISHDYFTPLIVGGTAGKLEGAQFLSEIHAQAGILKACSNYAPSHTDRAACVSRPSLAHWSDAAFLQWASMHQDEQGVRSLNYILREDIQNANTLHIAGHIIRDLPQYHTWPGAVFPDSSDECMALLGTPNGSGIAWFLAQHREQLGHKVVDRVALFEHKAETGPGQMEASLNMLFYLRDV